jgi:RNA polymerase sigma factor (TIGR02999 family)
VRPDAWIRIIPAMGEVTRILEAVERGDTHSADRLLPFVYAELRALAAHRLSRERPGQTLQPTALVHEAFLRLVDVEKAQRWNSVGHFFGAAAEAMRRILVENARRKRRWKHGGGHRRVEVEIETLPTRLSSEDLLALDEALDDLREEDALAAQVVNLRYFAGLTMDRVAEYLGVSTRTAERTWSFARAWLHARVRGESRR